MAVTDNNQISEVCAFCGHPRPSTPIGSAHGELFCSAGCRGVYETLGPPPSNASGRSQSPPDPPPQPRDQSSGTSTTFFRIDGMHSATCESYLERIATNQPGISAAEASYVTESIRVTFDPERVSTGEIRDALSRLGYTAFLRDQSAESEFTSDSTTSRAREMSGIRKRRSDHMLGARYIVGIVFGTFLLIPYLVMLYPVYLASLFDGWVFSAFENSVQLESSGGLQVLRVYVVFTVIILFFTGIPVLRGAYMSLRMRTANTDLLVSITVLSAFFLSIVAVILGRTTLYFDTTVLIAASVTAVVFFESSVKHRALDRLTELTNSQVTTARLYTDDGTTDVAVSDVAVDDRVLVSEGERVPVDGILDDGECLVDESIVTGDSFPVVKHAGDEVIGGSVVVQNAAVLRVNASTSSQIDQLTTTVWNLQSADHGEQRRANALAARLIPIVLVVTVLIAAAVLALTQRVLLGVLAGLTVMLVACPWALGFATPLSVATSIDEAVRRGIVVFDETVFERLRDVDVVVFDKTGTLTTGEMEVRRVDVPADLLRSVVALERRSSHPAAEAIVAAFDAGDLEPLEANGGQQHRTTQGTTAEISDFHSHTTGIEGVVDGQRILVGNRRFFRDQEWTVSEPIETEAAEASGFGRLPVLVGRGGRAVGLIVLGDEPRADWDTTITRLGDRGIEVVVLTGDDADATTYFRQHPHVTHVFTGVPPAGKTATIRRLQATKHVTMIGDGTNDAPALAEADLGIALGSGTALAADAADLAIFTDDLPSVETAFDLAHSAGRRVTQNNRLALVYNALLIPITLIGPLNPLFVVGSAAITMGLITANSARDLVDPEVV